MSTRSTIAYAYGGKFSQIYVHFDGYIKGGVGELLLTKYTTLDKVMDLLRRGDLSALIDYNEVDAYADRGEDVNIREYESTGDFIVEQQIEEYNYLFINGEWWVNDVKLTLDAAPSTNIPNVKLLLGTAK